MFHLKPVLVSLCLLAACLQAHAESSSSGSSKGRNFLDRADKREAKRWTLQEWLEQRDRNRMMDLWLSLNSPSPYEFMLGISHHGYSLEQPNAEPVQHTSYSGAMSAYAQIVGVTAEYENNAEEKYNDLNGLLNLRLFGESIQSSYLAVHYGLRTRTYADSGARVAQHFSQVSLQMYAIKAFGFAGLYRLYYPAEQNIPGATPAETSGNLTEAGAFIDFKNFRLFGDWYKEQKKDRTSSGAESSSSQTGVKSGIKIFF
jgi:hypothetical protein